MYAEHAHYSSFSFPGSRRKGGIGRAIAHERVEVPLKEESCSPPLVYTGAKGVRAAVAFDAENKQGRLKGENTRPTPPPVVLRRCPGF